MREVTKREFFDAIGPQNVSPDPQGRWPYTTVMKTQRGEVRGRIESHVPEGEVFPVDRYYLPEEG